MSLITRNRAPDCADCRGDLFQRSGSSYQRCLCLQPALVQAHRAFRWVAYILAATMTDWPKGKLRPLPPRDWPIPLPHWTDR